MIRKIGKVYVDQSTIHGQGVFAAVDIAQGEAILAIDHSRIVTPQRPLHPEAGEYDHYCSYLANGQVVLLRYPERYINHSCRPNAFVRTLLEVRYVFALRDIPSGDEITYDYAISGFGKVTWACNCGSQGCRHSLRFDFFQLPGELQTEYLPLLEDWYVREHGLQIEALLRRILGE